MIELKDDYETIIDDTIEYLQELSSELFSYYEDDLEEKIKTALLKIEAYLVVNFQSKETFLDLIDEWNEYEPSEKSLELIKDWDTPAIRCNIEAFQDLTGILAHLLEDNFSYLLACSLLGAGRGFWELFDGLPCLNSLV